jgi:hypothetical protein
MLGCPALPVAVCSKSGEQINDLDLIFLPLMKSQALQN